MVPVCLQFSNCLSVCLHQISISDYVVFDQGSLFQTLLQATQSVATVTRAPVERVVAFLSQYSQCQPSLVSANSSGVWVASGRNQLHLARGSLVGQSSPVYCIAAKYAVVQHSKTAFQHTNPVLQCSTVYCSGTTVQYILLML